MFTAYIVITVLAALANAYAATLDFTRSRKILPSMGKLGCRNPGCPH